MLQVSDNGSPSLTSYRRAIVHVTNTPPTNPIVEIITPSQGASFEVAEDITVEANATAREGAIAQVEFFVDGNSIGVDNTAPYTYVYSNATKGAHTLSVVATDTQGEEGTNAVTIQVNVPQAPFGGAPHLIPGKIELEEYDEGGNNNAYYDDSPGSETENTFREDEDVDIEDCTDEGGGYNIGYATAGEWLEYTVDVETLGYYDIDFRVACNGDNRTVSLSMGGENITSDVAISNTEGWQTWQTVTVEDVLLEPGKQVLRLTMGDVDYVNMNHLTFHLVQEIKQEPFNTTAHLIPGHIEAEEYDLGGEGLAYHEANTNGNEGGGTFRNDEVDIEVCTDDGGGFNIGYSLSEEWLEYTVDVQVSGLYTLDLRVAKDGDGGVFHLEIDGQDITGNILVPNTDGWQTWETLTIDNIALQEGEQVVRVVFDANYINFNWMEFKGLVTNLNSDKSTEISIFPNPFSHKGLNIQAATDFQYHISNVEGELLEAGTSSMETITVGNNLPPGVYFLSILQKGEIRNIKILKKD